MSTTEISPLQRAGIPDSPEMRVAIVRTVWNSDITVALSESARRELMAHGLTAANIDEFEVPGAVELTFAAARLMDKYDAVIVFGCVIRGGTPHFDYVCQSVTAGITALNERGTVPVIFGVLTVDRHEDAVARAGGEAGDKGLEAAQTALLMHKFCVTNS